MQYDQTNINLIDKKNIFHHHCFPPPPKSSYTHKNSQQPARLFLLLSPKPTVNTFTNYFPPLNKTNPQNPKTK